MGYQRSSTIAVALLAMLGGWGPARSLRAQTLKGTILGTITDSSQAVMPAVQVVVTETHTNGWQAGIFTAQTGTPFNITVSNSTLNTTAGGNYGGGRGDPRQFQVPARIFF